MVVLEGLRGEVCLSVCLSICDGYGILHPAYLMASWYVEGEDGEGHGRMLGLAPVPLVLVLADGARKWLGMVRWWYCAAMLFQSIGVVKGSLLL